MTRQEENSSLKLLYIQCCYPKLCHANSTGMASHILLHLLGLFLLHPFLQPLLAVAQTNGTISLGWSLVASENSPPLPSPSGDFAFGFHRLDNQNLFLLAIWFDKVPEKTLVWYANGDKPAPEGSKIELTRAGQFRLVDPKGNDLWTPNSAVFSSVAYAALLDTGNFVLVNRSSGHVWESFKQPADTILPTQEMEFNGKLSSRQTESNYSRGRFELRLLMDGNLVLNTIAPVPAGNAYNAYYWSNTLGTGDRVIFHESGYLYVHLRNESIVNLTSGNVYSTIDYYHRVVLEYNGVLRQYAHPKDPGASVKSWYTVWFEPQDICSAIQDQRGCGTCGFNSYCELKSDGWPACECIPGFSVSDPNNKFKGCKQDIVQKCVSKAEDDRYVMKNLSNTFWPSSSNFEELQGLNEDECSRSCLNDCDCTVAVSQGGTCWKKKLPLSNGRLDRSTNKKAFIKVANSNVSSEDPSFPESRKGKTKDQSTLILVVSLLLGSSVFLNFLLVAAVSIVVFSSYQKRHKLARMSSILETNLRTFTFEDLKEATEGFKEELGRGAFGTVYKGVLSSSSSRNTNVAVKKLEKVLREGEKEFKTEASAIAKTHHRNLVRLLGFCDEGPHKLLVYEFMSNGTLADFLFRNSRPDWNKRIQMAFGIARGLVYLHEECSTQIIHCDIKPQNILLDDSFTARISDFGLAKLLMNEQTRTHTAIRGTKGYVAPEWFRNTAVTAKVDVYSYGVMLLEIVFCRKCIDMERENEEEAILIDWVYDCYKGRTLHKLVENDEAANDDMRLEKLVTVAIWCIQENPILRPSMKKVIQMLEGVIQVSEPPCPSPFSSVC